MISRLQHNQLFHSLILFICWCFEVWLFTIPQSFPGGGGTLYFRVDIILIRGLSKHTLSTYFPRMKIHPNYMFLHVFFLLHLSIMAFPKFVTNVTKPFFPPVFAWFCTPKQCTHIHRLVLKNNPNKVNFYLWGWYPTLNTNGPRELFLSTKAELSHYFLFKFQKFPLEPLDLYYVCFDSSECIFHADSKYGSKILKFDFSYNVCTWLTGCNIVWFIKQSVCLHIDHIRCGEMK